MRWGRNGQWVLFERYVIGPDSDPYMIRWRLFECLWFRVYFHRIQRSDADRHLHDHPWKFVSVIIRGGYWEVQPDPRCPGFNKHTWVGPGSIVARHATDLHRITLRKPAWTLVIAGRRVREWGFQTQSGWVNWKDYEAAS